MERIFVQIASYRDPECQWTVKDLFEKARHPERISAGICWQYDEAQDADCFTEPYPYPDQVRTLSFQPHESKGVVWARAQAQSLWRGEDYVLAIDAHVRFAEGWDEALIETLARCPSKRPVLSGFLPGYAPPNALHDMSDVRATFVMADRVGTKDDPQIVHLRGGFLSKSAPLTVPLRSAFRIGNFLFARSGLMMEVPFDPYIYPHGEEISYSARLWAHGYDVFQPDSNILFYWWSHADGNARALPADEQREKRSFMRVKHLLRLEASRETAAIADLVHYGLGDKRSLEDFWKFSGVNLTNSVISEHALKGKWETSFQKTMQEAQLPRPQRPRIFVQIASYRDPECQWTVKDLFDKAAYPERITIGICWQYDPEEDKEFFRIQTRPEQVRIAHFHWKESKGVCWARHQTQLLWQGEEYTFVIDSHMRFEFGWDEKLISELALCPSPKAILTNCPACYTPPHDLQVGATPTYQRIHLYQPEGDVRFRADSFDYWPEKPVRAAFIAAGLMFSKSDIIREVPYDPLMYFGQEEMSLAARFFTHGWDVYHMNEVLVYHFYNPNPDRKKRPLHWDDSQEWGRLQERGRKRFDHLIEHTLTDDPEATRDLMQYGLGSVRTLAEFEAYCGVDFKRRQVSERSLRAQFIKDIYKYKVAPVHIPEIDGDTKPGPYPQNTTPAPTSAVTVTVSIASQNAAVLAGTTASSPAGDAP